jgi:hypothetical protein
LPHRPKTLRAIPSDVLGEWRLVALALSVVIDRPARETEVVGEAPHRSEDEDEFPFVVGELSRTRERLDHQHDGSTGVEPT